MDRPNGIDHWDGYELKRNESLTEEEMQIQIEETLKHAAEQAEKRKGRNDC